MIALAAKKESEALSYLESAIEHQAAAVMQAPQQERFRAFLDKHYVNYARCLLAYGRVSDAIDASLARRELWPKRAEHLYSVALELARSAAASSADPAARDEALNHAVNSLERIHALGTSLQDLKQFGPMPEILTERLGTRVTQLPGRRP